jgi:hypothetical protein
VQKLPLGGRAGSEAAAQAAAEAMQRHKGIGVSYSMGMPNTKTQVQRYAYLAAIIASLHFMQQGRLSCIIFRVPIAYAAHM